MIEMCYHYSTTGWPDFKPLCIIDAPDKSPFKAGLHCHSKSRCPGYTAIVEPTSPSVEPNPEDPTPHEL